MSRQPNVKAPEVHRIFVTLTKGQRERIAEIAERENRTVPGQVRHLIDRHIAEYDERVAA